MLDSIYIGMSGLTGYSRGLRVIANNSANLNTPGFKSATLQFADQFYSNGSGAGGGPNGDAGQVGHGLNTHSTQFNFSQGELRQTGNDLDLAVNGEGLFVLKGDDGALHYTRAGQFEFNSEGMLVSRTDSAKVMAHAQDGTLSSISINGLKTNAASATKTVTVTGNLSSSETQTSVSVKVLDEAGGEHTLTLRLTADTVAGAGTWKAELLDGTTSVGTDTLVFVGGSPTAETAKMSFTYKPTGLAEMPLAFDFSSDVTSFAANDLSTLVAKQDGFSAGAMTKVTFDDAGVLVATYSNGQTVKGAKLALARFDSLDAVESNGDNSFVATDARAWTVGNAGGGGFGTVQSGSVEISNVDLSREFSDLVIMQRGYQASSQIVSTANEMIQELFSMKNK